MIHISDNGMTDTLTKAGPPVTVTVLNVFGVALPEIVQIITIVYLCVLIIDKCYSWYSKDKRKKEEEDE